MYEYYCRVDGVFDFPRVQGSLLTMDDHRLVGSNASCLSPSLSSGTLLRSLDLDRSMLVCSVNQLMWRSNSSVLSSRSSLMIVGGSLRSNETYQFMVMMTHRQTSARQSQGYLRVRVEDRPSALIVVG